MVSSKNNEKKLTGNTFSDQTVNCVILLFGWAENFNRGWDVGQGSFKAVYKAVSRPIRLGQTNELPLLLQMRI